METGSCPHEQQVRHLKSRVTQLEIMLDKAHRMGNMSVSQVALPHGFPATKTNNLPVEVKKTDEYRRLLAELESERHIKADLMANLRQLTNANESEKAVLLKDLEETRTARDGFAADLEELQEEFQNAKAALRDGLSLGLIRETDPASKHDEKSSEAVLESGEIERSISNQLTVSSFRTFLDEARQTQVHCVQRVLQPLLDVCLPDICPPVQSSDLLKSIEEARIAVADMKARSLSAPTQARLSEFLRSCQVADDQADSPSGDQIVAASGDIFAKRIAAMEKGQQQMSQLLYRAVPSALQDLFALLSRSSSFVYPETQNNFDDTAATAYEDYLKTTNSTLQHTIRKYISSHSKSRQKISYRAFAPGDLALFLPTRNANSPAWAAFNVGAPHYFLDMEYVDIEGRDFLIGRVQEITERNGIPGTAQSTLNSSSSLQDERKWWEVKIVEKKKKQPQQPGESLAGMTS